MPTVTRFFSASRLKSFDYVILIREATLCGSIILLVSGVSDRLYYGEWTFPPYQFLNFNVNQDLAVFYGRNDWHYYLSQGLPLLLTTYLPFTLVGLWSSASLPAGNIRFLLTTTALVTLATLSLISHKEVRFIYPLLPLLHVLTAPTISSFFLASTTRTAHPLPFPSTPKTEHTTTIHRKPLLALLLALNLSIGAFTTLHHQRGILNVLTFLRHEYETSHPSSLDANGALITSSPDDETFAALLMPCHSTPWRSQLFYPSLKAWALTCEPPLHLAAHTEEREAYRDEADRFFDNPGKFLREEVNTRERPWPRFVVGFEGIEKDLRVWYEGSMKGFKVKEKWRGGNSAWHDDWRRQGDVVVWEFVEGV
jgi:GPI mannosyltransferase 3